jgi:hypothetical protein
MQADLYTYKELGRVRHEVLTFSIFLSISGISVATPHVGFRSFIAYAFRGSGSTRGLAGFDPLPLGVLRVRHFSFVFFSWSENLVARASMMEEHCVCMCVCVPLSSLHLCTSFFLDTNLPLWAGTSMIWMAMFKHGWVTVVTSAKKGGVAARVERKCR